MTPLERQKQDWIFRVLRFELKRKISGTEPGGAVAEVREIERLLQGAHEILKESN